MASTKTHGSAKLQTASEEKIIDHIEAQPLKRKNRDDWDIIRHEWVTTDVSLSDIAEKYGISFNLIKKKYNQQKWSEELKKYKNYVKEEYDLAMREKARSLASRVSQLDEAVLSASEKIIEIVEENLQKVSYSDSEEIIDTADEDSPKASASDKVESLKQIATALKIASEALKNSHYSIRLAGDKATEIIDSRNSHSVDLSDEEKSRIEKELGLIGQSKLTQDELLSERDLSEIMDGSVQSQNPQK